MENTLKRISMPYILHLSDKEQQDCEKAVQTLAEMLRINSNELAIQIGNAVWNIKFEDYYRNLQPERATKFNDLFLIAGVHFATFCNGNTDKENNLVYKGEVKNVLEMYYIWRELLYTIPKENIKKIIS